MTQRLPRSLSVALNDDETTMSFVSRVAWLNRRPPGTFCHDIGVDPNDLGVGEKAAVERLAYVTWADPAELERRLFVRVERNRYRINGEVVAVQGLDFDALRVCPSCLAEDRDRGTAPEALRPYRRVSWVFTAYRSCPRHDVGLLLFPEGSGLDFAGSIQRRLSCLAKSPIVEAGAKGFESYVDSRLWGNGKTGHWLDFFRIDAAGRVCEMVGACDLYPGTHVSALDAGAVERAARHGYNASCLGDEGVKELLGKVQRRLSVPPVKPSEAWPALHRYLCKSSDVEYDPLRDLIFDLSVATMPLGPGNICLGKPVKKRSVHSVRSAARQIRTHPTRLRRLLEKGGFVDVSAAGLHNDRVFFDASRAQDFLELARDAMPWQAAARYMNLSVDFRWIGKEYVKPLVESRDGRLTQHTFPKSRLDTFLRGLMCNGQTLTAGDVHFQSITDATRTAECATPDIVRMLLEKQLQNVRIDPNKTGFQSVFVDPAEVRTVVTSRLQGMTITQAENMIRTSSKVVRALVNEGLIETFVCRNPLKGRRRIALKPLSVEEFADRYVSLGTLSKDTGIHHVALKGSLDKLGVKQAFRKDLLHARFYERKQVRHLI